MEMIEKTPQKRELESGKDDYEGNRDRKLNPSRLEQDLKRLKLELDQEKQINSTHHSHRPLSLNGMEMNASPESVSSSWSVFACSTIMMSPINLDNNNNNNNNNNNHCQSEYQNMNQVLKECHFMRQRRKFQQDRDREHASFLASLQTETNRYVESTQIDFLIEKMIDVGEEEEEDL